jgi:hypothetical protein
MVAFTALLIGLFVVIGKKLFSSPPWFLRLLPYFFLLLCVSVLTFLHRRGNPKSCSDLDPVVLTQKAFSSSPQVTAIDPAIARLNVLREDIRNDNYEMLSHATQVLDGPTLISQAHGLANSGSDIVGLPLSSSAEALQKSLKDQGLESLQAIRDRIGRLKSSADKWNSRAASTRPEDDLGELRREFDTDKLSFSLESAYANMHDLQTVLNNYLLNKKVVPSFESVVILYEAPDSSTLQYEERIRLDLEGADAREFDFSGFALYQDQLKTLSAEYPGEELEPQVLIGYGSETPSPVSDLTKPVTVLTRSVEHVTIIHRVTQRPALHPTCTRLAACSFQEFQIKWPFPSSVRFAGTVELHKSKLPLKLTFALNTDPARLLDGVWVPKFSFFESSKTFKTDTKLLDGAPFQYLKPDDSFSPNSTNSDPVTMQLFPDNWLFRNSHVQEKRDLFFPVNAWLALIYLIVTAVWAELTTPLKEKGRS